MKRNWTAFRTLRLRLLEAQGKCRICGRKGRRLVTPNGIVWEGLEVDHIVPIMYGGTDVESNLQVLCVNCHHHKTMLDRAKHYFDKFK